MENSNMENLNIENSNMENSNVEFESVNSQVEKLETWRILLKYNFIKNHLNNFNNFDWITNKNNIRLNN